MHSVDSRTVWRELAAAAVCTLVVAGVAVAGAIGATDAADRYATLNLPWWAPPPWLFGPVWTALYVLIAVSGWLFWREATGRRCVRTGLGAYGAQLILNMGWPWLFFGFGWYGLAVLEIAILLGATVVNIVLFANQHRLAALLLVPYLMWTAFAAVLNIALWLSNS